MFKPMGEEHGKRSDTETGDTDPHDHSKKKVEPEEIFDLSTEE
jgi:hypothetical protein